MTLKNAKKVGFYGGSFDPIHLGHLNLLIELKERCDLDEVWVCPAYVSPFKQSHLTAAVHHRLAMTKLATSDIPYCKVLEIEIHKKEISYTFDTLETLSKQEPNVQLHLMIGDDCLPQLPSWKNIDKIIKKYPLLIGKRQRLHPILPDPDSPLGQAVRRGLTETTLMEISATALRERLQNTLYCGHLLPEQVLRYITYHQIYTS